MDPGFGRGRGLKAAGQGWGPESVLAVGDRWWMGCATGWLVLGEGGGCDWAWLAGVADWLGRLAGRGGGELALAGRSCGVA